MKKSTIILDLLKHLVSEEDVQTIVASHGYQDVGQVYGLPTVHYSTLSKKASEVPYAIFKDLFLLLLSRCNRRIRRSMAFPKELLLIDSTTMTVGEDRLIEPGSNVTADFTCQIGTPQKRSEHRHRIVEFTDPQGNVMRVVTNL